MHRQPQRETWRMGKGKYPSRACAAQERKLWPLAASEQRTPCRHDCGPARAMLKYAQVSEKYAFVLFHMRNYTQPLCCRTRYTGMHMLCQIWALWLCTAHQCVSTSSCASAVRIFPPPWAPEPHISTTSWQRPCSCNLQHLPACGTRYWNGLPS